MARTRKENIPQHADVQTIAQFEEYKGIDSRSFIPFILTVGATAAKTVTVTESPRSLSLTNASLAGVEVYATITFVDLGSGDDYIILNATPIPPNTMLVLDGDEIAIVSKIGLGTTGDFVAGTRFDLNVTATGAGGIINGILRF